jgi:plasmid stabilization system protein ParE
MDDDSRRRSCAHRRLHSRDNPAAPRRVAQTIYQGVGRLRTFPNLGRIGLAQNTRELIFTPWPYIAVYEIVDTHIHVLRIRHAAQDWP